MVIISTYFPRKNKFKFLNSQKVAVGIFGVVVSSRNKNETKSTRADIVTMMS